jgi:hypothetical protein
MDSPLVNRIQGQTFAAVSMGALAMLWGWMVLHPSRRTGFTGAPLLTAFERMKTLVLLVILGRVYLLNGKEDDPAVRAERVDAFTRAASISVIVDTCITLFKLQPVPCCDRPSRKTLFRVLLLPILPGTVTPSVSSGATTIFCRSLVGSECSVSLY